MGDKFLGGVSMIGPTALASVVGGIAVSVTAPDCHPCMPSAAALFRQFGPMQRSCA